jgi:hypothetical protein
MIQSLNTKQIFFLLLLIGAIIYVPWIAVYLANGGIPPDYFMYPPTEARPKPGFHLGIFISFVGVGLLILVLYVFPRVFGFKKVPKPTGGTVTFKRLPIWFWLGLITWGVPLYLFSIQAPGPNWITNWALLPLFWGFTLLLDGIVYAINNGDSMVAKRPTDLIGIGVASISGWMLFDYLNFYIERNWYYPAADQVNTHNYEFLIYAALGSSGFFPMAFEWYYLLRKVKVLNSKYSNGPKIKVPRWLLIVFIGICLVGMFITPAHPDKWFYILWLAPLIIIASGLSLAGVWTPFTPLRNGDWTALLTFALTYLIQGVLLEAWNYISADHSNGALLTYNAAYWQYCLPYVHRYLLFEMPALGYLGYLFFSIHCYLWWILAARLLGINTAFETDPSLQ